MPEVEIDLTKSLQENAARYFDQAKKARKKLQGAEKALKDLEKKKAVESLKEKALHGKAPEKKRKKAWFEQFHWFESSDGFLVIGGRDAQSNEVIVKKRMEATDIYFHADIHGAPHCIVKSKDGKVPASTKREAAVFAAAYSKAWQGKLGSVDVYSVKPEQVSKKSQSGESLGTGAFMIYGQREWFRKTPVEIALGVQEKEGGFLPIAGPLEAVKRHAKAWVGIIPGEQKKGEVAKLLKNHFEKKLGAKIELDELVRLLPAGGCQAKIK